MSDTVEEIRKATAEGAVSVDYQRTLLSEIDRLREELRKVIAHTGLPPGPSRELLIGLLAHIADIASEALKGGGTDANVANVAFQFRIGGVTYAKAAVAAGTAPGNED